MNILRYIARGTVALLSVVLFVIGIGSVLSFLPERTGFHAFVVLSGSMEPAIPTGSLVIVSRQSEYHVGDVVTRATSGKGSLPITHRIVNISNEGSNRIFQTKGDANRSADEEKVWQQNIIGRVMLTIPYLGYPVHTTRTPIGFFLLVVLPGILILIDEIWSLIRLLRDRRQTNREHQSRKLTGASSELSVTPINSHLSTFESRPDFLSSQTSPSLISHSNQHNPVSVRNRPLRRRRKIV